MTVHRYVLDRLMILAGISNSTKWVNSTRWIIKWITDYPAVLGGLSSTKWITMCIKISTTWISNDNFLYQLSVNWRLLQYPGC